MEKIIRFIAVIYFVASVICGAVLYNRLASYRQQLVFYRTELADAHNRQSDIANIVERTEEVLSSTTNSVADLRIQIAEVRKSYEDMANLLNSSGFGQCGDDNIPNIEE